GCGGGGGRGEAGRVNAPVARTRCQATPVPPERQATWPGQSRHRTADRHTPETSAAGHRSASARPPPTRGAPPLTTLPLPAGPARPTGGGIQPLLLRGRVDPIHRATRGPLPRPSTPPQPRRAFPP